MLLASINCGVYQLGNVGVAQSRDLKNIHTQTLGEQCGVNYIATLFEKVAHVKADNNRTAGLEHLRCQIQAALDIGYIDQVNNSIGLLVNDKVTRDYLFRRVRTHRVDAGKVGKQNVLVLLPGSLFFLNRNARPVTHVAI